MCLYGLCLKIELWRGISSPSNANDSAGWIICGRIDTLTSAEVLKNPQLQEFVLKIRIQPVLTKFFEGLGWVDRFWREEMHLLQMDSMSFYWLLVLMV